MASSSRTRKDIREIEQETGKSIITSQNAIQLNEAVTQLIEAVSEIDDNGVQ